jgi:hypothetical protein
VSIATFHFGTPEYSHIHRLRVSVLQLSADVITACTRMLLDAVFTVFVVMVLKGFFI